MWPIINTYLIALIMIAGVYIFGKIVIEKQININKRKFIILLILISFFQTVTGLMFSGTLKTMIITISNIYFFKYTFGISIQKAIFLAFLHIIILIFPDAILFFISQINSNINNSLYNIYYGDLLRNLISFTLFTVIIYSIRNPLRKLINTEISNNIKILIYSNLTLICVLIIFYKSFSNIFLDVDLIIDFFAMLVFVIILFSLIKQKINNNKLIQEYDKLLEFMTTYENEIEKQRILRHEIKNEFRTIRAKICDKQKNKEIIEYIDEIVNDKYEIKQEEYAKFGYLPPNGIKGLCYFKVQEAEVKGIKVALNISKRIKQSTIYDLDTKEQRDFGRILGVFLDNAIEASKNSEKKQLGIEAYINEEKEFRMIISNTYNNEIDKEKIGKETFSTKGKGRGHGLLLVKHLTENSEIFQIHTDIQEKIYVQTIIIKKK